MNLINLVKITPLLMSSLMGINKATNVEPYKFFSLMREIQYIDAKEYFVCRPTIEQEKTWPIDLEYIEFETYGNDFKEQLTKCMVSKTLPPFLPSTLSI